MALDSGYWEGADIDMSTDDVASLLVRLYGEYAVMHGSQDEEYAKAVAIAVRMLTD